MPDESVLPLLLPPLWLSLRTAATATLLVLLLAIPAAHLRLRFRHWSGNFLDTLLLLPLALPPTVIGLLLLLALGRASPVGQFLAAAGLSLVFTWPAAVLAATVVSFPLLYHSALAAFRQIDPDLPDMARVLGFGEWAILWRVRIPLAWPGLAAGLLLTFVRALGEFGATLMLAGNIPGQTQTAPLAIFFLAESGHRSAAILLSLALLLISAGFLLLLQRIRA